MIEVGEAGEWPLVLALFEHAVEQQAHKHRAGSQGTRLCRLSSHIDRPWITLRVIHRRPFAPS
jgi:hypothetical protein